MPKVYILDVTNRDGVQTARIGLPKLQKTMLNYYLAEMGVHQSEFGFPFTPHEANYLNANVELAEMGVFGDMILEGWCRAICRDVEESLRLTKVKHLNVSISTSSQMIVNKFRGKMDHETVISEMMDAIQLAKEKGIVTVGANCEDASRTELDYLIRFAKAAKQAGAERVRYCDTLGYDDPVTIYDRIYRLASEVGIAVELHCHNDLGLVVANSVMGAKAAVDAGVDAYINTTVNGIGERAGNADLLSCCLALKFGSGFKDKNLLDETIDLTKAYKISRYASYAFGIPIPINQPGVGDNAFAHESGIHADGALKDRKNYELYDYEELGRGEPIEIQTGRVITTGEYGGIKGFTKVYQDLGIEWSDMAEAGKILELVQYANAHTGKPLTDDELRFIAKYPDQVRKILTVNP